MVKMIISGGQTGADRAALDFAIKAGIPHGGWIPKGRKTENGVLPPAYRLKETLTTDYAERTRKNIWESDGTLILSHGGLAGGSAFTMNYALQHSRCCLHVDLDEKTDKAAIQIIKAWLLENDIATLNIAGPRASEDPRIYVHTKGILHGIL